MIANIILLHTEEQELLQQHNYTCVKKLGQTTQHESQRNAPPEPAATETDNQKSPLEPINADLQQSKILPKSNTTNLTERQKNLETSVQQLEAEDSTKTSAIISLAEGKSKFALDRAITETDNQKRQHESIKTELQESNILNRSDATYSIVQQKNSETSVQQLETEDSTKKSAIISIAEVKSNSASVSIAVELKDIEKSIITEAENIGPSKKTASITPLDTNKLNPIEKLCSNSLDSSSLTANELPSSLKEHRIPKVIDLSNPNLIETSDFKATRKSISDKTVEESISRTIIEEKFNKGVLPDKSENSFQTPGKIVQDNNSPTVEFAHRGNSVDAKFQSTATIAASPITSNSIGASQNTVASIDTNKTIGLTMQAGVNNTNALNMRIMQTSLDTDSTTKNNYTMNTTNPASNSPSQGTNLNRQGFQIISLFNFGDRPGAPGQPPTSNMPDFLVPTQLITYETSIEINFRKIPPPQPPPPPRFIKKMLVHTESLERRTRAFLSGNFETGTTDSSLRTARQKIRSLKSTILKSDDEVKHAEDTIHKAQCGDFKRISAPPIIEQPLYEFIEIQPSQRVDEECVDVSDRHSDHSQSIQKHQELENMEDYYSSKYSSRTSRHRVEGKPQFHLTGPYLKFF